MRHLIVGWRRGGMSYIYKCLKSLNMSVGNTFQGTGSLEEAKQKLKQAKPFEVSSDIVPYLSRLDLPDDLQVTFLLRDPMRVLNSLYFLGLFHNERSSEVQTLFKNYLATEDISTSELIGRPCQFACFYLSFWLDTYNALTLKEKKFLKVESYPLDILKHFKLTNSSQSYNAMARVRTDCNASNTIYSLKFNSLPAHCIFPMKRMCKDLGYYEPLWNPRGGHAHYVNPEWHH